MASFYKKTKINGFRKYWIVFLTFISVNYWSQTIYYSRPTGNLELTSSWSSNSSGIGGTSPNNFNGNNCLYIIANRTSATIGANWNIAATSTVQVGNGSAAVNFIIPSTASISDKINVTNTATLTIQNTTIPEIGVLSSGSTVNYALTGNQTVR